MSISEKKNKLQQEITQHSHTTINTKDDIKLKSIYDRYHNGKTIIMDDLKYVCLKDPDGCKILIKSIIEAKVNKELEKASEKVVFLEPVSNNIESTNKQKIQDGYKSNSDTQMNEIKNGMEMMSSIKSVIENMNEIEKLDMLNNLYQTIELIKLSQNMKYWDDTFQNKLLMYTYGDDKAFNVLT